MSWPQRGRSLLGAGAAASEVPACPSRLLELQWSFQPGLSFVGKASGSLKYLWAGPCFCSPNFLFYFKYIFCQAEIRVKEETEGRESSTYFLPLTHASRCLSFHRASQALPLKTRWVAIALGIIFFSLPPSVSADFVRNSVGVWCVWDLVQGNQTKGQCLLSQCDTDWGTFSALSSQFMLGLKTDFAESDCMEGTSYPACFHQQQNWLLADLSFLSTNLP